MGCDTPIYVIDREQEYRTRRKKELIRDVMTALDTQNQKEVEGFIEAVRLIYTYERYA